MLDRVGDGVGHVHHLRAGPQHVVPGGLVVARQKAEATPQPVFEMILLDQLVEFRPDDMVDAIQRETAREGQDLARERMALHGNATLGEAHGEPQLDPARTEADDLLVGRHRLECGVGNEQRRALREHAVTDDRIAVHEDDDVVLKDLTALAAFGHRAQGGADAIALPGLGLAGDLEAHFDVAAMLGQEVCDHDLVALVSGAQPDRAGRPVARSSRRILSTTA